MTSGKAARKTTKGPRTVRSGRQPGRSQKFGVLRKGRDAVLERRDVAAVHQPERSGVGMAGGLVRIERWVQKRACGDSGGRSRSEGEPGGLAMSRDVFPDLLAAIGAE